MPGSAESLGIYLSVPFCRAKCSFCNFASGVGSAEALDGYVNLLCDEIAGVRTAAAARGVDLPGPVDSIYLGGGTPSLLEPKQLSAIFHRLHSEFSIADTAEITLEAAPGQIGDPLLQTALRLGVNRVSLGVQTFVDREATAVGRSHTEASCLAEFARLRSAGVRNLGADLIAGLPHQTEESWEHSLEMASGCGLQHLSVYMLEVDEDSRLGREVLGGGARLHAPAVPSDELTAALYEQGCAHLAAAGYEQYEISNFAGPDEISSCVAPEGISSLAVQGFRSKHNLRYWAREPYLGFGLDAHSMLRDEQGLALRWGNPDELPHYRGATEVGQATWGSQREAFEESVFLRLRLCDGLPWEALARFPKAWQDEVRDAAAMLTREGLMGADDVRLFLTNRGRLVSSAIFGELLTAVAA